MWVSVCCFLLIFVDLMMFVVFAGWVYFMVSGCPLGFGFAVLHGSVGFVAVCVVLWWVCCL